MHSLCAHSQPKGRVVVVVDTVAVFKLRELKVRRALHSTAANDASFRANLHPKRAVVLTVDANDGAVHGEHELGGQSPNTTCAGHLRGVRNEEVEKRENTHLE